MRNYDRVNAPPPRDIENKRAHIVVGGVAGLSAAIALIWSQNGLKICRAR